MLRNKIVSDNIYFVEVKLRYAEVAQLVERLPSKQNVAGPSPVFR